MRPRGLNVGRAFGAWLFILGLTAVLAVQVLGSGGIGRPNYATTGVQRFEFLAWVVALAGVLSFSASEHCGFWQNLRTRSWALWYSAVVLVMFGRGIMTVPDGQPFDFPTFVNLLRQTLLYLAPLLVVPAGAALLRDRTFQLGIAVHASVGGVITLWLILAKGLSTRIDYLNADLGMNLNGGALVYALPLAVLLLPHLPRLAGVAVSAAALGWVAYGITFQSRIASVVMLAVFGMLAVGFFRRRWRGKMRAVPVLLVLGGFLVLSAAVYSLGPTEGLSDGLIALGNRWRGHQGVVAASVEDIRYTEASIVAGQMTWLDWLVGRGIIGTWDDYGMYAKDVSGVRHMVHVGYLHFAFVGGVGLWWLFCVAPLVAVRHCWHAAVDLDYVAVAFVTIRAVELLGYGVPHFNPPWLVTCVCLGAVFDCAARATSPERALPPTSPTRRSGRICLRERFLEF